MWMRWKGDLTSQAWIRLEFSPEVDWWWPFVLTTLTFLPSFGKGEHKGCVRHVQEHLNNMKHSEKAWNELRGQSVP